MRRFNFRFQRILEIKERMEEVRKIALGEVIAVLNQEQDRLAELQQTQKLYRQASQSLPDVQLDASLLSLNDSYLLRLQREIQEQLERVHQVEEAVEAKRLELMKATKERRVYESLKERAVEDYQREQKRRERIFLDEVGEQLYMRCEN